MTINYYNDIEVYFHMKNHYKRLKNVKSKINNNISQVYMKSTVTSRSEKCLKLGPSEEGHNKNCPHLPNHSCCVKKHNCISSDTKSDSSIRSCGLPSRPTTRRHPYETFQKRGKTRSHTVGPTTRKDACYNKFSNSKIKLTKKILTEDKSPNEKAEGSIDSDTEVIGISISSKKPSCTEKTPCNSSRSNTTKSGEPSSNSARKKSKSSSKEKEHEYLQFLLRITEDIIINDYYTNNDIRKVFENHIEANKDYLDMKKMMFHIGHLCKELNIDYKDSQCIFDYDCDINLNDSFQSSHSPIQQNLKNCECGTNRSLIVSSKKISEENDVFNVILNNEQQTFYESNCFKLKLFDKHSLGRVTECTEPTASINTLINSPKIPSFTTVSSFGNVDVLPGFENLDIPAVHVEDFVQNYEEEQIFREKELIFGQEKCDHSKTVTDKNEEISDHTCFIADNRTTEKHLREHSEKLELKDILKMHTTHFGNKNSNVSEIKNTENNIETLSVLNNRDISDYKIVDKHNEVNINELQDTENIVKIKKPESTNDHCLNTQNVAIRGPQLDKTEDKSNYQSGATVKLILDGHIKDEDYILVNGPVYVLKALIETDPKLILIKDKLDSIDKSQEKNKEEEENAAVLSKLLFNDSDEKLFKNNEEPILEIDNKNINIATADLPEDINDSFTESSNSKSNESSLSIIQPALKNGIENVGNILDLPESDSSKDSVTFTFYPDTKFNGKTVRNEEPVFHDGNTRNISKLSDRIDASEISEIENLHSLSSYSFEHNQFPRSNSKLDGKLLNADYDLTPEKDESSSKYNHFMMIDASTSISNVTISKNFESKLKQTNLLLSDNYLLQAPTFVEGGDGTNNEFSKTVEKYLKPSKDLAESDYVNFKYLSYNTQTLPRQMLPLRSLSNLSPQRNKVKLLQINSDRLPINMDVGDSDISEMIDQTDAVST